MNTKELPTVCVLMSTYNGSRYLEEQLDSIVHQKNVNTIIYIRDDGSTDHTISIIKKRIVLGEKIVLLEGHNIGAEASFYSLINYCCKLPIQYNYYAFADQDDVWLPEKLEVAIKFLGKFDGEKPNLYYSNLKVVDEGLHFLYNRFSKGYVTNTKKQVLAEVCSWGCTCVFNYRTLKEMDKLQNKKVIYHDNWILWVCTFLGNTYYDEDSYILYRQHGKNLSGEVKRGRRYLVSQFKKILELKKLSPVYEIRARLFLEIYEGQLQESDRKIFKMMAEYRYKLFLKIRLIFGNDINSGHLIKEISRRIRIITNKY